MQRTIYKSLQQGTQEWHDVRCGLITASEVGCLLTKGGKIADNKESRNLILKKAAQRITGCIDKEKQTFDMMRGHDDEEEARDVYTNNLSPVEEVGFIRGAFEATTEEGDCLNVTVGYSPDGLVGDVGLIECKSRKQHFQIQTILNMEMPQEYQAQVQFGLMVSGRQWCDFISFPACGGGKMMVLRVYPDEKFQHLLRNAVTQAEAQINALVEEYQAALTSGKAQFFDTERRDYDDPSKVEFF